MPKIAFRPANLENPTVRKILAAALRVWTEQGYHGASLKDVAAEAGVAKSLLHYHFASKEHLLIELQTVYSRKIAAAVRDRLGTHEPSVKGALKALDQVWDAVVAIRDQFPFALEVWRASVQSHEVRERLEAFEGEIHKLLLEGVVTSLGPLAHRMALPPERVADLLQVGLGGLELGLFLTKDVERMRRVYEDFKTLIAASLLPDDAGGAA